MAQPTDYRGEVQCPDCGWHLTILGDEPAVWRAIEVTFADHVPNCPGGEG